MADPAAAGGRRAVFTGEIRHLRLEGSDGADGLESPAAPAGDRARTPVRAEV